MSDYSEQGAVPVEDAAVDDPPTVDDVLDEQRRKYPEQARTAMHNPPMTPDEAAALDAGGTAVDASEQGLDIEGPNSD